jgi:hypothetical protein
MYGGGGIMGPSGGIPRQDPTPGRAPDYFLVIVDAQNGKLVMAVAGTAVP